MLPAITPQLTMRSRSGRLVHLNCDRLAFEGRNGLHAKRVMILRQDASYTELMIGVRQYTRLVRAGFVVDELWLQTHPERGERE